MWVAPLLLSRRHAARIVVRLGCTLPPALPGAPRERVLVLATARHDAQGGVALRSTAGMLSFALGGRLIRRFTWPPRVRGTGCVRVLTITERRWALTDAGRTTLAQGPLDGPATVNGLLTNLDLRRPGLAVSVTTEVDGSAASISQDIARGGAALLIIAMFTVLLRPRLRRGRVRGPLVRALSSLRPADGAVVAVGVSWWILSPAFFDDGWVRARQLNFGAAGRFSNYFDTWGASFPFGYWLEWVQHWLTIASSSAVVLRLFPLSVALAAWIVCRVALRELLGAEQAQAPVVEWTLTATFLLGFVAWGMTLRTEPPVDLLVIGSLAATARFLREPSLGPLALIAALSALAIAAHPAGAVVLAPALAASPELVRWARAAGANVRWEVVGLALGAVALTGLLVFLGTDLSQWREQVHLFRLNSGYQGGWLSELHRYSALSRREYGTPARRLSVALFYLALLAYVTRRARRRSRADLAARSLAIGLALLVLTPSKWPWHFGGLAGIGAIAMAAETARFLRDGSTSRFGWSPRPVLAVAAVLPCIVWAWAGVRNPWVALDLHRLAWEPSVGAVRLGSATQWVAALVAVVLAVVVWEQLRQRVWTPSVATWRVSSWLVAIVIVSTLAYTIGYFARDAQATAGWTLARQNIDSLKQETTCGLGDVLRVPRPGSVAPLAPLPSRPERARSTFASVGPWGRPPRLGPGTLRVWGSRAERGGTVTPWFRTPPGDPSLAVGIYVSGSLAPGDMLTVEWGHRAGGRVILDSRAPLSVDDGPEWRLVPVTRGPEADVVRVAAFRSGRADSTWLAFSAPVRYVRETVAGPIRAEPAKVLIAPTYGLYFPCDASVGRVAHGVAETVPRLWIVAPWFPVPLLNASSPFAGVDDLTGVFALPLESAWPPPGAVAVYGTQSLPAGEAWLPAARVT